VEENVVICVWVIGSLLDGAQSFGNRGLEGPETDAYGGDSCSSGLFERMTILYFLIAQNISRIGLNFSGNSPERFRFESGCRTVCGGYLMPFCVEKNKIVRNGVYRDC
jgi:hypothetical protein